jgi:hypothetical protein
MKENSKTLDKSAKTTSSCGCSCGCGNASSSVKQRKTGKSPTKTLGKINKKEQDA